MAETIDNGTELNLETVQKYFEANGDNPELKEFKQRFFTPESVDGFLGSEDGKKVLQPKLDKHFTKGLETWKQNNLNSVVEEEINKRFPTESEEKKQLRQLQQELESFKKQNALASVKTEAMKELTAKGLPMEVADFLVDDNKEATMDRINTFAEQFNKAVKSEVDSRLKSVGGTPKNEGASGKPTGKQTKKDLLEMDYKQRSEFYTSNPEEFARIMKG